MSLGSMVRGAIGLIVLINIVDCQCSQKPDHQEKEKGKHSGNDYSFSGGSYSSDYAAQPNSEQDFQGSGEGRSGQGTGAENAGNSGQGLNGNSSGGCPVTTDCATQPKKELPAPMDFKIKRLDLNIPDGDNVSFDFGSQGVQNRMKNFQRIGYVGRMINKQKASRV